VGERQRDRSIISLGLGKRSRFAMNGMSSVEVEIRRAGIDEALAYLVGDQ